jgi:aspartyl protease family protein
MAGSLSVLGIVAGLIGLAALVPAPDSAVDPAAPGAHSPGFEIPRAADGQFYADAKVGHVPIRFLVDPGADRVLIAGPDAARLGLPVRPGFTPVTLPRLVLGPHQARQVSAVIAPDLPVSLLGRSFLSRLHAAEAEGGRMILR